MPVLWEPAIYEHKAKLIGRYPAEVARSAELLAAAVLEEFKTYHADYLTVGLDVYAVEAEALGAKVIIPGEEDCPDIAGRLYDLNALPDRLALPAIPRSGRFAMLLAAGQAVRDAIGEETRVRVAASGPVTLAAKLVGLEPLILSLCSDDGNALRLLDFATELAERWLSCLRDHGQEAILFDSMAAPPMFSPRMYRQVVLPLHRRLMNLLRDSGQEERELVIGGDTSPIAAALKGSGATILLCDYASDAAAFHAALGDQAGMRVRRNVSPVVLESKRAHEAAASFRRDLAFFDRPIAGTGILPYAFKPEWLLAFMDHLHE